MKRKRFMKTIGLLSVIAMLVTSLGITAGAAVATAPPQEGDLVIHKYKMEDLGQAGVPNDGTEVTPPSEAQPLEGIEFTIKKVKPDASGQYPSTAAEAVNNLDASFTVRSDTTDNTGTLRFDDLPQGVYLVIESDSLGADNVFYVPSDPFLVAVPMTNATGNGWLDEVHIYPKNQSMTPGKTAEGGQFDPKDPQQNETINWAITVPIPVSKTISELRIIDVVDSLLTIDESSVVVETVDSKNALATSGTTVPGTHYSVSFIPKGTLTVTFDQAGVKYLQDEDDGYLRVRFSTDLTDEALGLLIENNATLEFTNDEGTFTTDIPDTERPKAYTGTIGITKVTNEDGAEKPLEGAIFKVAKTRQDALDGNFLKDVSGNDLIGTSDTSGYLELRGIPYGTAGVAPDAASITDTFWIMEIQAPSGYSLLDGPIEVTFNYDSETDGDGNVINYFNKNVKVFNTKQFTLPGTGSAGIIISTILGVVLLAGVILVIARRRTGRSV